MTAKSETVGVVAVQRWECRPLNWEVQYHQRDDGEWVKFTDHESALAELRAELHEKEISRLGAIDRLEGFRIEHERLITGLEALAGEWERENFFGASEQLRALIPAAANTESEEGRG